MKNLQELQNIVWSAGWHHGKTKLTIDLINEFEGFYGKSSNDWEKNVTISLTGLPLSSGRICPEIKCVGLRFESIDDVAEKVIEIIESFKNEEKTTS